MRGETVAIKMMTIQLGRNTTEAQGKRNVLTEVFSPSSSSSSFYHHHLPPSSSSSHLSIDRNSYSSFSGAA
jgi:hypothetical protein